MVEALGGPRRRATEGLRGQRHIAAEARVVRDGQRTGVRPMRQYPAGPAYCPGHAGGVPSGSHAWDRCGWRLHGQPAVE
jgi:hypothetical protein